MKFVKKSDLFNKIGIMQPGKSAFNLSHQRILTMDMGELIPILCHPMYPGDTFELGINLVARMMPTVAPILHEINAYVHTWFVPFRILWPEVKTGTPPVPTDGWEVYFSGGEEGTTAPTLPTWNCGDTSEHSLWDHLGFPLDTLPNTLASDFPRRAYNEIWNEKYRQQEIIDPVDVTSAEDIQMVAKYKDYFTTAGTDQQRGTSVSIPITGSTSAVWTDTNIGHTNISHTNDVTVQVESNDAVTPEIVVNGNAQNARDNLLDAFNANTVDLSAASAINIADLNLLKRIQRMMELQQRAGARYNESVLVQFGEYIRDDRIDRPELVGRPVKFRLSMEAIPQTSEDGATDQGNLVGAGVISGERYIGKYHTKEHGVLMSLLFIRPRNVYDQGMPRVWSHKTTHLDWMMPIFAPLAAQPIFNDELYTQNAAADDNVFGYAGRYDELRFIPSSVHGLMHSGESFDHWHVGIDWAALPSLDQSFIECDPKKSVLKVTSDPAFVVAVGNMITAKRKLPVINIPIC